MLPSQEMHLVYAGCFDAAERLPGRNSCDICYSLKQPQTCMDGQGEGSVSNPQLTWVTTVTSCIIIPLGHAHAGDTLHNCSNSSWDGKLPIHSSRKLILPFTARLSLAANQKRDCQSDLEVTALV